MPKDLPPKSTVNDSFDLWNRDGTLDRMHEARNVKCRAQGVLEDRPLAVRLRSALTLCR